MSGGFYERLSAISSTSDDANGMGELVVAALGSFGRYYICWKTRSGEYKQESSGLPLPLYEWLFPPNGQTRDFPTLQVVLGHGDDFFASDAHGKVERKATTPDRTSLSSSPQPAPTDTPNPSLDRASRRRSRTMSMVGPPVGFRLSQSLSSVPPIIESPVSGGSEALRTRTSRPPSSSSFVPAPLARVRTERDWKRRPRSIAFGEEDFAPELQGPRARKARGGSPPVCACGCHASSTPPRSFPPPLRPAELERKRTSPPYTTTAIQTPPPPQTTQLPRKPTYVNAAIQTDPLPPSPPPPPPRRRRPTTSSSRRDSGTAVSPTRSARKRASISSTSSSASASDYDGDGASSTASRSRRSSAAATDITTPSTYGGVPVVKGNPVVMGQMQSYFRSSGYQLGDALRPVSLGGGGAAFGGVDGGLVMAWREVLDRRRTV